MIIELKYESEYDATFFRVLNTLVRKNEKNISGFGLCYFLLFLGKLDWTSYWAPFTRTTFAIEFFVFFVWIGRFS